MILCCCFARCYWSLTGHFVWLSISLVFVHFSNFFAWIIDIFGWTQLYWICESLVSLFNLVSILLFV